MQRVRELAFIGLIVSSALGAWTPIADGDLDLFSPSAEARTAGVGAYRYFRDGGVLQVEVLGRWGTEKDTDLARMATVTMQWRDGLADIVLESDSRPSIRLMWRKKVPTIARFERWPDGELLLDVTVEQRVIVVEPSSGSDLEMPIWTALDGSEVSEDILAPLAPYARSIELLVVTYDDVFTNLGFKNRPREGCATGGSGVPESDCLVLALCSIDVVDSAAALTRSGCCEKVEGQVNARCAEVQAAPHQCVACCEGPTCTSTCLIGSALCSCTGYGKACGGVELVCPPEPDWPPEP